MRKTIELRPVDVVNSIQRGLRTKELQRIRPRYVKPDTSIVHTRAENRNGKKIQLRDLRLNGYLKVYRDRKQEHWCYCERGADSKLRKVVASPGWDDVMDTFRPDFVPITAERVKQINLRLRAFH